MVIWLIGMSGSGKTTLGREVARQWRALVPNVVLLDGDKVREVFCHDRSEAAYTITGRRESADRMTALCEMLDRQGINVVCCILSIFPDIQRMNRSRYSGYFEVFMDAPLATLRSRDVKGLYAAFDRGGTRNVVGMDIPFPRPVGADMIIDSAGESPDIPGLANIILEKAGVAC